MAHVEPSIAFDTFKGKLSRKERIVMRTRYGRTEAYAILNPYKGPISENRKPIISAFSQAVKQCKSEMSDTDRFTYWQDRYTQYCKMARRSTTRANMKFLGTSSEKYYVTLRGFIIASLSIQFRTPQ